MKMKSSISLAVSAVLASGLFATQASAAGFALIENSASGMGNAYAGGSAVADDASTVWFNPAGMTRLKGDHISVAGHIISTSADFTDQGSTLGGGGSIPGTLDDGGITSFVPNFYYVTELGGDAWFGLGVTVPFGLSTEYDEDWIGRYGATTSEVSTVNFNPSFAFKQSDALSIGLGLSLQYIEATLENHLDSTVICNNINPASCGGLGLTTEGNLTQDSKQALEGDDWNWGWNIGLLYDLDDKSRIGFAYRSSIDANLSGDVDFTINPALQTLINGLPSPSNTIFSDTGIDAGIELPAQLSVSYFRDVTDDFAVMADITWTEWSNFNALVVKFDGFQPTSITPENWEDSYRFAIGANYRTSDTLLLRMGLAHDQTPIPSPEDRTARIPGDDRTWLSFGFGYNIDAETSIDVGYSHLFVSDTEINNTDAFGHTLTGEYDADVNILSVQGNFKF